MQANDAFAVTDKLKDETTATHAGRMSAEHFGVINTPVYRASTILYPDLASLEAGRSPYTYGRRGTPTHKSLEDALTELEGGARTVLCTSGLNAIALAILSVCSAGDHLLVADSCYEPTRKLCDRTLKRFGIETTYYDPLVGSGIADLMRPNTKAVFCESPGSLTFEIQDIPAIAAAAHKHGASVLLDNTWATPLFFKPFEHGVDLSIQAITKYVGGHADVMVGYVTSNESHRQRLLETHGDIGLYISGDDAFLALRGLRTLPLRLGATSENGAQDRPLARNACRGFPRALPRARIRSRPRDLEARFHRRNRPARRGAETGRQTGARRLLRWPQALRHGLFLGRL